MENSPVQLLEKEIEVKEIEQDKPLQIQKSNTKIWIIMIIIAILVILIAVFSTIFATINIKNPKILKGITVNETDISNLTKEQAIEKLNNIYGTKAEKQIYLTHGDYETSVTYEALEAKYQIQDAVEQAYKIGRDGNVIQNNFKILETWHNGKNIKLDVTLDNDMIEQIGQNINNSINDAVVQPSYYVEKKEAKLIITAGKQGVKVNEEQLKSDIYNILNEDTEDEQKIDVPMIQDLPEKVDLNKIHEEIYKEVKDAKIS